nr:MAG TPA: hypothetical protein [Caudoviricetes sp.]
MDICRSRFALRRLREDHPGFAPGARNTPSSSARRGEKARVERAREQKPSTLPHTGVSHSLRASLASFFISRLTAVKGGSPGNAQRLTSERGAPVRRR